MKIKKNRFWTRRGTWISAVIYYSENFQTVRQINETFVKDDFLSINIAQKYLQYSNKKKFDFEFRMCSYSYNASKKQDVSLSEAIEIVQNVSVKLNQLTGTAGTSTNKKYKQFSAKTKDFKLFILFKKTLTGKKET